MKQRYQIIYLNGPSSSGKSTLARALQNTLRDPFLVIGIDKVIGMMPERLNDWNYDTITDGFSWQPVIDKLGHISAYKIHVGPFGKRMIHALKDIVVMLAQSGHYIIIDDVSFGKMGVDAWQDVLRNFNVFWVGVSAPISILEQREKERGNRKIGSARWQAEHVHVDVRYDLMIDTYEKSIDDNVALIQHYLV